MTKDDNNLPSKLDVKSIDEAIKAGNFDSLTNNKFLKVDDIQALGVIKDLFEQVKRANPGLNEFSFSLLTLFSAVMEIWGLTQDRERFKKFQREQLPKDLEVLEKKKNFILNDIKFKKTILDMVTKQYEALVPSDSTVTTDIKEVNKKINIINDLTHKEKVVLKAEEDLRDIERKIDSMKTSIELKHYNISDAGAIYTNMENNLLSKFERIGKLLDQFNLNPSSIVISAAGEMKKQDTATDGFGALTGFGGDKKVAPS